MDAATALEKLEAFPAHYRDETGALRDDTGKRQLGKIRYEHQDMVDFLIANPNTTQNELAARYGYSPSFISILLNSDAFQSFYAERRNALVDPVLVQALETRFKALTQRSVDRLLEELDKPACKPEIMLRAAELGAKTLGMGGHAPPPAAPSPDGLSALAERLVGLQSNVRRTFNGEATEVPVDSFRPAGTPDAGPRGGEPAEAAVRADAGDAGPAAL